MNDNKPVQPTNHVTFSKRPTKQQSWLSSDLDQDEIINDNNNTKYCSEESSHHIFSNLSISDPLLNSDFSENETECNNEKHIFLTENREITISSDPLHSISGKFHRMHFTDLNDQSIFHPSEKNSTLMMRTNKAKRISLQNSQQMTLGNGKINKNNLQKININGTKVNVGLGFPTKRPIITDKNSNIIQNSEKSFENLEDLIQKIKINNFPLDSSSSENEEEINDEEMKIKFNNLTEIDKTIIENDISRVTNDFNIIKNKFIEMESKILTEFNDIKLSIKSIIEYRKDIQKQHQIWLQNMKTTILKTKKENKDEINQSQNLNV